MRAYHCPFGVDADLHFKWGSPNFAGPDARGIHRIPDSRRWRKDHRDWTIDRLRQILSRHLDEPVDIPAEWDWPSFESCDHCLHEGLPCGYDFGPIWITASIKDVWWGTYFIRGRLFFYCSRSQSSHRRTPEGITIKRNVDQKKLQDEHEPKDYNGKIFFGPLYVEEDPGQKVQTETGQIQSLVRPDIFFERLFK